jgi:hypothetical protein
MDVCAPTVAQHVLVTCRCGDLQPCSLPNWKQISFRCIVLRRTNASSSKISVSQTTVGKDGRWRNGHILLAGCSLGTTRRLRIGTVQWTTCVAMQR